jgi:hypothetical protein
MRRLCLRSLALAAACLASTPALASAQPVELADGRYASAAAYLAGTWMWQREQPRELRRFTFGRDGGFAYENATQGRTSYGNFETMSGKVRVTMIRVCDGPDACSKIEPPVVVEEPVTPLSADVFMSNSERWTRVK